MHLFTGLTSTKWLSCLFSYRNNCCMTTRSFPVSASHYPLALKEKIEIMSALPALGPRAAYWEIILRINLTWGPLHHHGTLLQSDCYNQAEPATWSPERLSWRAALLRDDECDHKPNTHDVEDGEMQRCNCRARGTVRCLNYHIQCGRRGVSDNEPGKKKKKTVIPSGWKT